MEFLIEVCLVREWWGVGERREGYVRIPWKLSKKVEKSLMGCELLNLVLTRFFECLGENR
jgi:hypothetical protein